MQNKINQLTIPDIQKNKDLSKFIYTPNIYNLKQIKTREEIKFYEILKDKYEKLIELLIKLKNATKEKYKTIKDSIDKFIEEFINYLSSIDLKKIPQKLMNDIRESLKNKSNIKKVKREIDKRYKKELSELEKANQEFFLKKIHNIKNKTLKTLKETLNKNPSIREYILKESKKLINNKDIDLLQLLSINRRQGILTLNKDTVIDPNYLEDILIKIIKLIRNEWELVLVNTNEINNNIYELIEIDNSVFTKDVFDTINIIFKEIYKLEKENEKKINSISEKTDITQLKKTLLELTENIKSLSKKYEKIMIEKRKLNNIISPFYEKEVIKINKITNDFILKTLTKIFRFKIYNIKFISNNDKKNRNIKNFNFSC